MYKIERPVTRKLVCRPRVMNEYNEMVGKQLGIHRIQEILDVVDNLTWICG